MFNWFESKPLEQTTATDDMMLGRDQPTESPEPVDNTYNEALYTVGRNTAGMTQLRVKIDYGSTTLMLDPTAVRQLIRQLKATL